MKIDARFLILVTVALAACAPPPVEEEEEQEPDPADVLKPPPGTFTAGVDRPVQVVPPSTDDGTQFLPLVLLLHGYSGTGGQTDSFLRFTATAEEMGFVTAHPEGTVDQDGNPFWNATGACCDFYDTDVDDSAYLSALITEIQTTANIDAKRIFLIGHSNGGFMSYRMACDHADQIAGIASVAGAMLGPNEDCAASEGVYAIQVHGTSDDTILFAGGPGYPSATGTAEAWASVSGCGTTSSTAGDPLDLDRGLAGAETTRAAHTDGCRAGGGAELWTVDGGEHIPSPATGYVRTLVEQLFAHPKP